MPKPFSKQYVLDLTTTNIRRSIERSILKTSGRVPEFVDDAEKTEEINATLVELNNMMDVINEYDQNQAPKG